MTTTITLGSGPFRCDIRPDLGGCIAGLWWHEVPVLRSTPGAQLSSVRLSGCYPLVPYSNRVAQAQLVWNGTSHPLIKNHQTEPHAIHGVGWQRPWEVLDQADAFALLSYEHRPDAAWPFAFDCSQAFRLTDDRLEISLSVTNQSAHDAPVGLGWHPYFMKHADSHLSFQASGRWEMGEDKLPTQRLPVTGLNAACADLAMDHCFDGWQGEVQLRCDAWTARVRSSLSRLVVFTQQDRDTVAIEPVSHVNNAFGLMQSRGLSAQALGLQVLQAGQSLSAEMSIQVSR
jgi:aldose 1-epimerase